VVCLFPSKFVHAAPRLRFAREACTTQHSFILHFRNITRKFFLWISYLRYLVNSIRVQRRSILARTGTCVHRISTAEAPSTCGQLLFGSVFGSINQMHDRAHGSCGRQSSGSTTPSLGAETRKKAGPVPSLLGVGVLRFLDLHLPILPYPRKSFFPSKNQHPFPDLFFVLQRPVYSPIQIPSTPIHHRLLLFTVPFLFDVRLCSIAPSALHTKNERNGSQGRRAVRPEGRIELVDMTSRYSFSDGEGPTRNGSYVRCVFHVLKPTPPLPTQPSVSETLSARMAMTSSSTTTRCTDERWLDA
jgi:hypothetical protein